MKKCKVIRCNNEAEENGYCYACNFERKRTEEMLRKWDEEKLEEED